MLVLIFRFQTYFVKHKAKSNSTSFKKCFDNKGLFPTFECNLEIPKVVSKSQKLSKIIMARIRRHATQFVVHISLFRTSMEIRDSLRECLKLYRYTIELLFPASRRRGGDSGIHLGSPSGLVVFASVQQLQKITPFLKKTLVKEESCLQALNTRALPMDKNA